MRNLGSSQHDDQPAQPPPGGVVAGRGDDPPTSPPPCSRISMGRPASRRCCGKRWMGRLRSPSSRPLLSSPCLVALLVRETPRAPRPGAARPELRRGRRRCQRGNCASIRSTPSLGSCESATAAKDGQLACALRGPSCTAGFPHRASSFRRFLSEIVDRNEPPMAKSFSRIDATRTQVADPVFPGERLAARRDRATARGRGHHPDRMSRYCTKSHSDARLCRLLRSRALNGGRTAFVDAAERLPRATSPLPVAGEEFVRAIGLVRDRRAAGVAPWGPVALEDQHSGQELLPADDWRFS
jgi:hypothetical protein